MRGDARSMTLLRPRTPQEALAAYARDPKLVPLAGGTDLMVGWNMGRLNGRGMLDLTRVKEWRGIRVRQDGVELGALATHAEIRDHAAVRASFPLLAQACAVVGAEQIQNRGTIGGNLANASPAGDTFPSLAVYQAVVRAAGPNGRRAIPVTEFFAGVKKSVLGPSELLESVFVPFAPKKPSRSLFRKVGTRAAQAISKTMFAGLLWLERDGSVAEARLAFGSLAPTVKRLAAAESFLKGRLITAEAADRAAGLLESDCSPIDDIRSTRAYRLEASRRILRNFLLGETR